MRISVILDKMKRDFELTQSPFSFYQLRFFDFVMRFMNDAYQSIFLFSSAPAF
jgi:hypothetical protein